MQQVPKTDLYTMIVLRRRFEAVIHEMINTLFRSGRSGVLNTAMDFSCAVTDWKMQSMSAAVGIPIHVGAIDLIPKAIHAKFGDDLRPGDCFVNNSAYHGNSHCGDFTLCAPVFHDDKLMFFSIARAHFGDMGFPTPTTYAPRAKDMYEEGLMLPCVRIQRGYKDINDVVDICKANIRAPEQFYGDYLATLAAVRTGERRIQDLCNKYGVERILAFADQYQDYAESMIDAAIRKLPKGRVEKRAWYDSELDTYPDGIPVHAILEVDPEAGKVTVDLTQNIDNLPLGINMTESTVRASCISAVLNILGPDIPRCAGSFKRIDIRMREGSAIGIPRFPAATSSATTNLTQLLIPHLQSMFAMLQEGLGTAYATIGLPASCSCVSGKDSRRGGRPFVNMLVMGYLGGPALRGHDGWLTYSSASSQGILWQSSVEVVEQQQPIIVERLEVEADSAGPGKWDGAPGARCIFRCRADPVRFITGSAGRDFPPDGVAGGLPGGAMMAWKVDAQGVESLLPSSLDVELQPGEKLISLGCGGGGYGLPTERDPYLVLRRVLDGWTSRTRAESVYGVILSDTSGQLTLDEARTNERRRELNATRSADCMSSRSLLINEH